MSGQLAKWAAMSAMALSTLSIQAAPIVFTGTDAAANSTDPRPASDAAASAFDAACLCASSVIDFESAALGTFTSRSIAAGVTLQAGTPAPGPLSIRNTVFATPENVFGYNTTAAGSHFASVLGGVVEFVFDDPIDAFGLYITGVQLNGLTMSFTDAAGAQSIPIPNVGSGAQFLGFTDVVAGITKVTLTFQTANSGDIVGLDDVRFRTANGVPEPQTAAIALLALAGLAVTRRRAKRD